MLTESEIRDAIRRRMWAVLPVLGCTVGAVMAYLVAVGHYRDPLVAIAVDHFGETAREITPLVLILPAFPIFLVPAICASSYADRFKTICPKCDSNVSSKTGQLLATRRCPSCDQRIVNDGRLRSASVYKRYLRVRSRWFLKYWFWAWPCFGIFCIAWWLVDHSAFQRCQQALWIAPLIGASASGWISIRTYTLRYAPQFLASVVVLSIGGLIFWYAL